MSSSQCDFFDNQFDLQKGRDLRSHLQRDNIRHHHGCYGCFGKPRRKELRRTYRCGVRSFIDGRFNRSDFTSIDISHFPDDDI